MRERKGDLRKPWLLFFLSALLAPPAQAFVDYTLGWGEAYQIDPTRDWRTIETDHFLVTFPAGIEAPAQRLAHYLEKAHSVLTIDLRWVPRTQVQALVMDNVDSANGLSTPLFRFGMILYVTPPEAQSNIAYTDDWLWTLAVHEYTHFLNMDATRGYAQVLRTLLGDGLLPNTTLPSWFLEGLAVYEETRWSQTGRGRAPYYPGALRAAATEGLLDQGSYLTLDRVNGGTPYFPFGDAAYEYGYQLLNYVSRQARPGKTFDGEDPLRGGMDALGLFSWRGGGRLPFFIDDNLRNITGLTWPEAWRGWVAEERRRAEADEARLRAQPFSEIEDFTDPSHEESTVSSGGAVSPDGRWLAYTASSAHRIGGLHVRELAAGSAGRTRRIADKLGGARLSFSPDSRFLFLSKLDQRRRWYSFSDLWVYDLEARRLRRLTDGMRARDPSVSPDGSRIAFALNEGARSWIAVAELRRAGNRFQLGAIQEFKQGDFDAASHPSFWGNGRVVYSLRPDRVGRSDLRVIQLAPQGTGSGASTGLDGSRDELLFSDGRFNRAPFGLDDAHVGFVSDRTGVDNVYRIARGGGEPEMLTHVRGGLGLPSRLDSGSIVATVVSGGGVNLARVKLAERPYDPRRLTLEPPPLPETPRERPSLAGADRPIAASRPYSAWDTLAPRVWGPYGFIGSSDVRLGAFIGGLDSLDRHAYFLLGQYAPLAASTAFEGILSYTYRGLGPRINLSYADQIPILQSSGLYLRERLASASLTYLYPLTLSSFSLTLAAEAVQDSVHRDSAQLSFIPAIPDAEVSATYDRAVGSSLAVRSEQGGRTTLGVASYLEPGGLTTKLFFSEEENVHLGGHWVLTPALRGQWASRPSSVSASQARVSGRSGSITNPLASPSISFLPLRGYPAQFYVARAAATGSLDLAFPLLRVFRGDGTLPFFLEQLYGVAFVESAFFPGLEAGVFSLPSVGGGLRLDWSALLRIPLTLLMEGHYGLAAPQGGGWDWVLGVNLRALGF